MWYCCSGICGRVWADLCREIYDKMVDVSCGS